MKVSYIAHTGETTWGIIDIISSLIATVIYSPETATWSSEAVYAFHVKVKVKLNTIYQLLHPLYSNVTHVHQRTPRKRTTKQLTKQTFPVFDQGGLEPGIPGASNGRDCGCAPVMRSSPSSFRCNGSKRTSWITFACLPTWPTYMRLIGRTKFTGGGKQGLKIVDTQQRPPRLSSIRRPALPPSVLRCCTITPVATSERTAAYRCERPLAPTPAIGRGQVPSELRCSMVI
jgi:hypothetical protein